MSILTKRELYALMMTRANKEPSKASPRHYYMDPASHVKFEREHQERAQAKAARQSLRTKGPKE